MLNLDKRDIQQLKDDDLRDLVGMLCEDELRKSNRDPSAVTFGGHQDAGDGGVDVRVDSAEDDEWSVQYIPRPRTIFQVKAPTMPPSSIKKEMRKGGVPQKNIQEVVERGGAYIIVSSKDEVSETQFTNRKNAMVDALGGVTIHRDAFLDFYDSQRIAGWVRNNPGRVLWIRDRLGKPLRGWEGFGDWAGQGSSQKSYLMDSNQKILRPSGKNSDTVNAEVGLAAIRGSLRDPRSIIRLAGLSGVGKTRFAQALFESVGQGDPLDQSSVFYTDIGRSPEPGVEAVAQYLVALKQPMVLVVDNCPPDVHRELTRIVRKDKSLVSLLTIEYDVKDDEPEDTEVYRLFGNSDQLISYIVIQRHPELGASNAVRIGEMSGGNARVALALARVVEKNESLSELKDEDLFERLFHQRNHATNSLLTTAEVCSLLYSFDVRTTADGGAELSILSDLGKLTEREVYAGVTELADRELIQARAHWRAVLPHALANRLATRALQRTPLQELRGKLLFSSNNRIRDSFCHRLGYLHNVDNAKRLASEYYSNHGELLDLANVDNGGWMRLAYLAPLAPHRCLQLIDENVASQRDVLMPEYTYHEQLAELLHKLAYEPLHFARCAALLAEMSVYEIEEGKQGIAAEHFLSLFQICYSGTEASLDDRLRAVRNLFQEGLDRREVLLRQCFLSLMQYRHLRREVTAGFGARPRTTGWRPKTDEEMHEWYASVLNAIEEFYKRGNFQTSIGSLLEKRYVDMLFGMGEKGRVRLDDFVEEHCTEAQKIGIWLDLRAAERLSGKSPEALAIKSAAKQFEPYGLMAEVRAIALAKSSSGLDLADLEEGDPDNLTEIYERLAKKAEDLGEKLAKQPDLLVQLSDEILISGNQRVHSLGRGICRGSENPTTTFDAFVDRYSKLTTAEKNATVLGGMIAAVSDKIDDERGLWLDRIVDNVDLSGQFPWFQANALVKPTDLPRIRRALKASVAPIEAYQVLFFGRAFRLLGDDELAVLMSMLNCQRGGSRVVLKGLVMRGLEKEGDESVPFASDLRIEGKSALIATIRGGNSNRHDDYDLARSFQLCFRGASEAEALELFEEVKRIMLSRKYFDLEFDDFLSAMGKYFPTLFLDVFLGGDPREAETILRKVDKLDRHTKNPFDEIDEDVMIAWCEKNGADSYSRLAGAVCGVEFDSEDNRKRLSAIGRMLLKKAPDPVEILSVIRDEFFPTSWSGSRAQLMEQNIPVLVELKDFEDERINAWAKEFEKQYLKDIAHSWKSDIDREREDYGFE